MTKHQKQAHDSTSKRSCLQWRPLNESLIMGKRSRVTKSQPWRPLDEILQSGIEQQQQKIVEPASPVPSEQSSGTIDEEDCYQSWLLPPLPKSYVDTPIFFNYYNQPFNLPLY